MAPRTRLEAEEASASFRGVPFYVKKRTRDGGRRGPTHEVPQRDQPDGEDLGRKCRTFKLDALVMGDDHVADAGELIAALEDKAGPGIYRDPWHGEWSVICRTYSAQDEDASEGVTVISITFEESGDTRYPSAKLDSGAEVDGAADDLSDAANQSFKDVFSVEGRPQYLSEDAEGLSRQVVERLTGMDLSTLDLTDAVGIPDLGAVREGFLAELPSMLGGGLGDGMQGLVEAFADASFSRRFGLGDADESWGGFASLADFGGDLPALPAGTVNRRAQADNRDALVALVRRLALAQEAKALAARSFVSFDEAMEARSATLARLDAALLQAGSNGDDAVFSAASALKAAVTRDVEKRALPLPRLRRIAMEAVLPARVVAHMLTGDGRKADDLVARNNIAHPAFVPAGRKLEILDAG